MTSRLKNIQKTNKPLSFQFKSIFYRFLSANKNNCKLILLSVISPRYASSNSLTLLMVLFVRTEKLRVSYRPNLRAGYIGYSPWVRTIHVKRKICF